MNESLDRAWADAQAALPPNWTMRELYQLPSDQLWLASAAVVRQDEAPAEQTEGFGDTPVEALQSLAANLAKRSGKSGFRHGMEEDRLARAWSDAERELPAGWTIRELYRLRAEIWLAAATLHGSTAQPGDNAEGLGPQPHEALLALAASLRMKRG